MNLLCGLAVFFLPASSIFSILWPIYLLSFLCTCLKYAGHTIHHNLKFTIQDSGSERSKSVKLLISHYPNFPPLLPLLQFSCVPSLVYGDWLQGLKLIHLVPENSQLWGPKASTLIGAIPNLDKCGLCQEGHSVWNLCQIKDHKTAVVLTANILFNTMYIYNNV